MKRNMQGVRRDRRRKANAMLGCPSGRKCSYCTDGRKFSAKRREPAPDTDIEPVNCDGCHEAGHDLWSCPTHWQNLVTGRIVWHRELV